MTSERTRRAGTPPSEAGPTKMWTVETKSILVLVPGKGQFEAMDALRSFRKEDFGLLVVAKEFGAGSGDEFGCRTSKLMVRWGRRAEALEFIRAAMDEGLPNTAKLDGLE